MIALALVSYAPSAWSLPALPVSAASAGGSPQVIQLSPDGARLYFADYLYQRIGVAGVDASGVVGAFTIRPFISDGAPARPGGLAVCPSGRVVVVQHPTGTVTLFDADLAPIGSAPSPRATSGAGPLNGIVCVARGATEAVYVNQDLSWTHVVPPDPNDPESMSFTMSDANEVTRYTATASGIALVSSVATGGFGSGPFANPAAPTRFLAAPRLVASPDGNWLFATNAGSSSVTTLAVAPDGAHAYSSQVQLLHSARTTGGLAVDAQGQVLYAALGEYSSTPGASVNSGIEAFTIGTSTGTLGAIGIWQVGAANSPIDGLRVHPNGQHLVVTAPEGAGTVQIVDRYTFAPVYEPIPGLVPTSIGFGASGASMYVGTAVGQIARTTFPTYTLAVTTSGQGSVTPGSGSYLAGSMVSLSASPATGYALSGWSGACGGTANPCTLLMDGDKSVGASFAPATSSFAVTMLSALSGTSTPGSLVLASVDGAYVLSCANGGTCSTQLPAGKQVTLKATPATGTLVQTWGGCTPDPLDITRCVVTTTGTPMQVTVTFGASGTGTQVSLSVKGSGTVGGLVAGGVCPGAGCTTTLTPGTVVTLSLQPAPGWAVRSTSSCVLVNSLTGCRFTVPSSAITIGVNFFVPLPLEE